MCVKCKKKKVESVQIVRGIRNLGEEVHKKKCPSMVKRWIGKGGYGMEEGMTCEPRKR